MKSAFKFRRCTRVADVLSFIGKVQSRRGVPTIGGSSTAQPQTLTARQRIIRDAEDRAFNTSTGAGFGFKLKNTQGIERTANCQRCVIAHEMRMRGFDVIARATWGERDTLKTDSKWFGAFEYSPADFVKCTGTTGVQLLESATQIMRSFGDGARAIVIFKWTNRDTGHVIVAQHLNGHVNFGDPQTREIGAIRLFSKPNLENVTLFRVDKLSFTDKVKLFCMNRSEFDDLKRSRPGGRKLWRRQSSQRKRLRRFLVHELRKRRTTRRRSRETPVP